MADGIKKGWGKLGGGSGKMHKFAGAGTQQPGGSSQEGHATGRRDQKAKAGGHAVGFSTSGNTSYAGTQTPAQSSSKPTGGDKKFASGGNTKMFGNRGSIPSKAGQSSP